MCACMLIFKDYGEIIEITDFFKKVIKKLVEMGGVPAKSSFMSKVKNYFYKRVPIK